jgi:ribosomal-protein-alanine N-acetyltransferase
MPEAKSVLTFYAWNNNYRDSDDSLDCIDCAEPPVPAADCEHRLLDMDKISLLRIKRSALDQVLNIEKLCHPQPWTVDNFLGEFNRSFCVPLGLWRAETLLAFAFFWLMPPETFLLNLTVHPDVQGGGLGRRLLTNVIDISKKTCVTQIHLEVRVGNNIAKNLYESAGFVLTSIRKNYYTDGEDAALMTLNIEPELL